MAHLKGEKSVGYGDLGDWMMMMMMMMMMMIGII
jgi:hypothetical protein